MAITSSAKSRSRRCLAGCETAPVASRQCQPASASRHKALAGRQRIGGGRGLMLAAEETASRRIHGQEIKTTHAPTLGRCPTETADASDRALRARSSKMPRLAYPVRMHRLARGNDDMTNEMLCIAVGGLLGWTFSLFHYARHGAVDAVFCGVGRRGRAAQPNALDPRADARAGHRCPGPAG